MVGNDTLMAVCSYGDMAPAEAERNLRLFASDVMPQVKQIA
jgi:hypothetical protein